MFKGSFVAIVTPFSNGEIDEKRLVELVEWHIAQGTDGIVPVGTTGESPTLTHREHARVIEIVTKAVRRRIPVIAGAGSNSTAEAISLSREAEALGADGVLSVSPYYNRPTEAGLMAHFSSIARSIKIPVILYNIPSRTGVTLTTSTMVALSKSHKNIIGVKESSGNVDRASDIIEQTGGKFLVISGDDSLTLPLMAVGASGVISVAANLIPKDVARLCALVAQNKYAEARKLHLKMFPLIKALFLETSPMPIKAAMEDVGLIRSGALRSPLVTITAANRKKLQAAIKAYGVKRGQL